MHTVELLEDALRTAERLGYRTRQEWLGGTGGGACEFAGQRWIFVDLALTAIEQLEQVTDALRNDPAIYVAELSPSLRAQLGIRAAA
jgi:hypothetical protein